MREPRDEGDESIVEGRRVFDDGRAEAIVEYLKKKEMHFFQIFLTIAPDADTLL